MLFLRHLMAISVCTALALGHKTAATAQVINSHEPTHDVGVAFEETFKQRPRITNIEELDDSLNPLLLPTDPDEVKVKKVRAITLEEAIEVGQRNNRQLRRARLELERSRFQLRETQTDLFPSLDSQFNYNRD